MSKDGDYRVGDAFLEESSDDADHGTCDQGFARVEDKDFPEDDWIVELQRWKERCCRISHRGVGRKVEEGRFAGRAIRSQFARPRTRSSSVGTRL
jgi:hypothetical protein